MITVLVTFWLYPEVGKIKQELASVRKRCRFTSEKTIYGLAWHQYDSESGSSVDGIALIVMTLFLKESTEPWLA